MKRLLSPLFCLLASASLLQAVDVRLECQPAGATVKILGVENTPQKGKPGQWVAPALADIQRSRSGEPYTFEFSKDGFETVRVTVEIRGKGTTVSATLAPLVVTKKVSVTSQPAGAQVALLGRPVGATPLEVAVRFERPNKQTPWSKADLRLKLADHQDEGLTVTYESADAPVSVELARLADPRELLVTAVTEDGRPIEKAIVEVGGQKAGETPARLVLPFARVNKNSPWNEFQIAVRIPDEYQRVERSYTYPPAANAVFTLVPVTEMGVVKYFPTVEMTPRGPRIAIDLGTTIGTATNDRDENSPAIRTVRITSFERKQPTLQAINSFAVTPDGQALIYGVTAQSEDGKFYSNLFKRSANPSNSAIARLTTGPRIDCYPAMCREEGSNLVMFQSNRSGVETFNIAASSLRESSFHGGISLVTREVATFNIRPSFASEAQPVYFTSLENFPQSEPRLASIRPEGTNYSNLGEIGETPNYGESGRIYFSRVAADTKTCQLFSIQADGTGIESILNDFSFSQANCHSPAVSPDGQRLLFVSDYNPDKSVRRDNNIWLLDLAGSRQPIQITTNPSDDIMPLWSPTEPDVIYFLSNRRGVYNIWQMAFKTMR
jgi:hypothetical protein